MDKDVLDLLQLLREGLKLKIEGSYLEIHFAGESIDSVYVGHLENDEGEYYE